MSGKIKECCFLHEEKTWTRSCVLRNLNFGSSQHRKEAQSIKRPPFPKLSAKFQRNRLPNVQDWKFSSVRPPPKFCLINLFMSRMKKILTVPLKAQCQPFSVLDASHNTISLQTIHNQNTQHVKICLTLVIDQLTVIWNYGTGCHWNITICYAKLKFWFH